MARDRTSDVYAHLHQAEMRKHAEQRHLSEQVRPARRYAAIDYTKVYGKWIFRIVWAWLGRRLIEAGQAMQSPIEEARRERQDADGQKMVTKSGSMTPS
jgi:hypothetical protein